MEDSEARGKHTGSRRATSGRMQLWAACLLALSLLSPVAVHAAATSCGAGSGSYRSARATATQGTGEARRERARLQPWLMLGCAATLLSLCACVFSDGYVTFGGSFNAYLTVSAPAMNMGGGVPWTVEMWAKRSSSGGDDFLFACGTADSTLKLIHLGFRANNQVERTKQRKTGGKSRRETGQVNWPPHLSALLCSAPWCSVADVRLVGRR